MRKKKTRTPLYEDDDQSDNKEMEPDQHTGAVRQVNEIKKQLKKKADPYDTTDKNRWKQWKQIKTDEKPGENMITRRKWKQWNQQGKHQCFPKW